MNWVGLGSSGLLVSEKYIRCLFMPTRADCPLPRMGFGLIGELAYHDTHTRYEVPLHLMDAWRVPGVGENQFGR